MTNGRGAWNNSGDGGTKAYNDSTKPGPYYYVGSGSLSPSASLSNYAVRHAVEAYQSALNRRLKLSLPITGVFDQATSAAVLSFQSNRRDLVDWGGIGPDTSKALLVPDLIRFCKNYAEPAVTSTIVSGIISHESGWDAGAVGYVDPKDLGLAQINGPAHPDLTKAQRFRPSIAFNFVVNYLNNAFNKFQNIDDAIASYNLGLGGAETWIADGRPEMFTPAGETVYRDVWAYINTVLEG